MRVLSAIAIILTLVPLSALAFTAQNRMKAAPVDDAVFEVVARSGGTGPRDYWCAAGDYVLSLGVRRNVRIYVVSGVQPSVSMPGRKAVRFTISPEAAGITPIEPQMSLGVETPGDNMSIASARQYCAVDFTRR